MVGSVQETIDLIKQAEERQQAEFKARLEEDPEAKIDTTYVIILAEYYEGTEETAYSRVPILEMSAFRKVLEESKNG